MKQYQI